MQFSNVQLMNICDGQTNKIANNEIKNPNL